MRLCKSLFVVLLMIMLLAGCHQKTDSKKYVIGVSQCSDDAWRTRMNEELERELIFHSDMSLHIRQAQDNSLMQCAQIDSFIAEGVDALVVSPNEAEEVKPAVSRAYDAGIPVVVADRQVSGQKYTAFIGGDNRKVGRLMGQYLKQLAAERHCGVQAPLQVLELQGLQGSTPMMLRHESMMQVLVGAGEVEVVAVGRGAWFRDRAQVVTDSLLRLYPHIDVIAAQNDQMAIGAAAACRSCRRDSITVIGVDALLGESNGLEAIADGRLECSVTYSSRGDLVIQTVDAILKGQPYVRDTVLNSLLIDREAANILLSMAVEEEQKVHAIHALEGKLTELWDHYQSQRIAIGALVFALIGVVLLLGMGYAFYRYRQRVRREQREQEELVAHQREQLESVMAELEKTKKTQSQDELFVERLQGQVELHIADSDLSVESLAEMLHMSRSQLFRRTKQVLGITPVELMRQVRLRRGRQMLHNTDLGVQQVAYSVGFTSPSYFTKCYKEFFGCLPQDERARNN